MGEGLEDRGREGVWPPLVGNGKPGSGAAGLDGMVKVGNKVVNDARMLRV